MPQAVGLELTLNRLNSYSERRLLDFKVQNKFFCKQNCDRGFNRQNYSKVIADLEV